MWLKIFKLSQHPQILLEIEVMKTEVMTYQALDESIKALVDIKNGNRKNTFDMSTW